MNEMLDFFLNPYRDAVLLNIILEIIAVISGITSVLFAKKEIIWVYPTGIISTIIYVYLCYEFSLYGDSIINIYYTLMSVYGWYMWTRIVNSRHSRITMTNHHDRLKALSILLLSAGFIVVVYLYFNRFDRITDYFDTLTTGIFFAAMWLMANKKIEHWFLWIIGNIISIPLYFVKGLGFTGIQFIIFLVLAYLGYKSWKKILHRNLTTS